MNVTGPRGLPALSRILQDANYVPKLMFFSNIRNLPSFGSSDMVFDAAVVRIDEHVAPYSPLPEKTYTQNNNLGFGVTLLWNKTIAKPLGGNLTFSFGPISYEDKVFTLYSKETRQWWGYSLDDGSLLWGPTASQPAWDMYGSGGYYAYGKLLSGGYGGVLYAYDIKTGKQLWNYTLEGIGHESPYGNYQNTLGGIADGKVFIYSMEHSPSQPLWRGSYLRAINATTGKEIWKILHFVSGFSGGTGVIEIADGCIVAGNDYDNQMYVYGKGPSATTVSASPKVITKGSSILIEGTVTDQSPGAKGIAAISDADQQAWMEYIYMQQEVPSNAVGVSVHLTAIDPNGNFQDIGTVTSDMSGMFKAMWKPPVEGPYTVIATFPGTESYASSYAETAFGVDLPPSPAVTTTAPPSETAAPTSSATQTAAPSPTSIIIPPDSGTPTTTYIAIGATVIIIVAVAAALVLKKRK
jgi:outer membrane protein assembly factor BamB